MKKQAGILLAFAAAVTLAGCGMSPEEQKALNERQRTVEVAKFKENGFEIVGSLSASRNASTYAHRCYTLKKIPDNSVTYKGCIDHNAGNPYIYNLEALEKGPTR